MPVSNGLSRGAPSPAPIKTHNQLNALMAAVRNHEMGLTLPPVFQEVPTDKASISTD
jgi:hypothetical protein